MQLPTERTDQFTESPLIGGMYILVILGNLKLYRHAKDMK